MDFLIVGNGMFGAAISFPGRPDLPSMEYIIDGKYEIDLELEVEAWLLDLLYSHYQRVMRNVDDFLATGGVPVRKERMMAGHSRWKTLQARRLAETGDAGEHPEYEQAGRDLRLGDQLRAIRRSRNLTQKEVAERAGISQPALSRIELGGGVPDIETLRRLGNAMGVRFHVIVGNEEADHEENLLVS